MTDSPLKVALSIATKHDKQKKYEKTIIYNMHTNFYEYVCSKSERNQEQRNKRAQYQ